MGGGQPGSPPGPPVPSSPNGYGGGFHLDGGRKVGDGGGGGGGGGMCSSIFVF